VLNFNSLPLNFAVEASKIYETIFYTTPEIWTPCRGLYEIGCLQRQGYNSITGVI